MRRLAPAPKEQSHPRPHNSPPNRQAEYAKRENPSGGWARDGFRRNSGGDLLSQDVSVQVPSAQVGLTAVFGMGTGVAPPL